MYDYDFDWDRHLVLRSGFGNVHDVGHGWDYAGLTLVADAVTKDTAGAWALVRKHAAAKPKALYPS